MIDGGLRCAFVASQARGAADDSAQARGSDRPALSLWAARRRLGNMIYGMMQAATDKMWVADVAAESGLMASLPVSLYPGLVRTERVLGSGVAKARVQAWENSESPRVLSAA